MTFQFIFAGLTIACLFYFLIAVRNTAYQKIFVTLFFSTGFIFICNPEMTNTLAHFLGIGRGVDFILYLSTLFLFFICFNLYLRLKEYDKKLTQITRELALRNPIREEKK